MKTWRAWLFPILGGIAIGLFHPWAGYWSLLIAVGWVLGVLDPWDSKGQRR